MKHLSQAIVWIGILILMGFISMTPSDEKFPSKSIPMPSPDDRLRGKWMAAYVNRMVERGLEREDARPSPNCAAYRRIWRKASGRARPSTSIASTGALHGLVQ